MKIFGLIINVKRADDEPPEIGRRYYHKDDDPLDMVAYVVPKEVADGVVHYTKFYKSHVLANPKQDQCPIREFNKWYRARK